LQQAHLDLDEATGKLERFRHARQSGATDSGGDPAFPALGMFESTSFPGRLMVQLAQLQQELIELQAKPRANETQIKTNREQFELLERMISSNLESTLAEKQKTYQARLAAINGLEDRLNGLHQREKEWTDLKRRVDVAEGAFMFFEKKLEEAAATAAMERQHLGNVEVIAKDLDPLRPVGIRKLTLLVIGASVGLLAALAFASVVEFFDHRIYDAKTLDESMNLPVLAVIPVIGGRRGRLWSNAKTIQVARGVVAPRGPGERDEA
ncbi:MAG: hypothetical protein PVI86_02440, partial [Phycisphaerae bacterium]